MFCSISGEVPQEPVVSRKSGALFEKRLISKYIQEEGKCPVTGEDLEEDDLIVVKATKAVRPRPIAGTSIPGLLATFQNEWDELMLETFTLKQHLDTTRQELAQSLYQHDAACRVIARLMVERDEARNALAAFSGQVGVHNGVNNDSFVSNGREQMTNDVEMSAEVDGTENNGTDLDSKVIEELMNKCTELSGMRRARSKTMSAAAGDIKTNLQKLSETSSYTPHKSDNKTIVTCIAARANFKLPADDSEKTAVVLSGSSDKTAVLMEQGNGKVLAKLQGHSKSVTAVSFHSPDSSTLITGGADNSVKIWNASQSGRGGFKYSASWNYTGHDSAVSGITLHPTGNYLVSTAVGAKDWHFLDIVNAQCLKVVNDSADSGAGYSSCCFHPDGLILAVGTDAGSTNIWDVREMKKVQNLSPATDAGSAAVTSISISENGYHAVSGYADGWLRLWDLRKLACTKDVQLGNCAITNVVFDSSGLFLAASGGEAQKVQIRAVKEWTPCLELDDSHSKDVTGLCWSQDAASPTLLSCGADRCIKIYS